MSVKNPEARSFYETESLRGGWTGPQLDRQISTLFYERTALSRNKAAMLKKGQKPLPEDAVTPEEEIKDPLVLEFLGLKDEYSENDLEEALILHLESFLLELGGDFTFVGRQRRLRIGEPPERRSVEQLLGIEGVRVRKTYQLLAQQYGVEWKKRNYDHTEWESGDVPNRCLSSATACIYGICEAAILAAGYAPAVGFIHTNKLRANRLCKV